MDDAQLHLLKHGKQKVILLRLPRDVSLESLDGAEISLNTDDEQQVAGSNISLHVENNILSRSLRPLVLDATTGKAMVGPSFHGSLSAKKVFSLNKNQSITTPIIKTYQRITQIPHLSVRYVPFGSENDLEQLRDAKRKVRVSFKVQETPMGEEKRAKRHKHAESSNEVAVDQMQPSSHEKKKKKKDHDDYHQQ